MTSGGDLQNHPDRILVALASDEKYVPGLMTTLWSVCEYATPGIDLCFHVLDVGISEECRRRIAQTASRIDRVNATVVFHAIDVNAFSGQSPWKGSYAAYARLTLQDILAEEDFIVYSDVDMLWRRDIAELWSMRDPDVPLWATRDGAGFAENAYGNSQAKLFATHGIQVDPNKYYNSGLMLLNLKKLREEQFTARAERCMIRHRELLALADQSIYNMLVPSPPAVLLDPSWGMLSTVGYERLSSPCVVHYAGNAPWTQKPAVAEKLWWPVLLRAARAVGWKRLCLHARFRMLLHKVLSSKAGFEIFYLPFRLMSPVRYHHRKKRMFENGMGNAT